MEIPHEFQEIRFKILSGWQLKVETDFKNEIPAFPFAASISKSGEETLYRLGTTQREALSRLEILLFEKFRLTNGF